MADKPKLTPKVNCGPRPDTGWGAIKCMAKGGMAESPKSIAEIIRNRRKKSTEVEEDFNSMEQPNMMDELNEDALLFDMDEELEDLEQPEDSNLKSVSIKANKHDRVSAIRRKMKASSK